VSLRKRAQSQALFPGPVARRGTARPRRPRRV